MLLDAAAGALGAAGAGVGAVGAVGAGVGAGCGGGKAAPDAGWGCCVGGFTPPTGAVADKSAKFGKGIDIV